MGPVQVIYMSRNMSLILESFPVNSSMCVAKTWELLGLAEGQGAVAGVCEIFPCGRMLLAVKL